MKKIIVIFILSMQYICYGSQTNDNPKKTQDQESQEIEERKKFDFGTHLRTNFPESNIIELLVAAYYLEPYQEIQAEKAFNRACKNFHAQKHDAQIDPATCTTIQEYLEKLKNIH